MPVHKHLLGLPVEVVTEDDILATPPTAFVCIPVAQMETPDVPSNVRECTECGDKVWMAKSTQDYWLLVPQSPILCLGCAMKMVKSVPEEERQRIAVLREKL